MPKLRQKDLNYLDSKLEEKMMISTAKIAEVVVVAEAVVEEVEVIVVALMATVVFNVVVVVDARVENSLLTTTSSQLFEHRLPASPASYKVRVKYLSPSAVLFSQSVRAY